MPAACHGGTAPSSLLESAPSREGGVPEPERCTRGSRGGVRGLSELLLPLHCAMSCAALCPSTCSSGIRYWHHALNSAPSLSRTNGMQVHSKMIVRNANFRSGGSWQAACKDHHLLDLLWICSTVSSPGCSAVIDAVSQSYHKRQRQQRPNTAQQASPPA